MYVHIYVTLYSIFLFKVASTDAFLKDYVKFVLNILIISMKKEGGEGNNIANEKSVPDTHIHRFKN